MSFIRMIVLGISDTLVPLIGLERASPVSNFIRRNSAIGPSLIPSVIFLTGGIIMSMQQHIPDQAVLVDSWMLFCPECSQKMRIIMAAPTHDGRETRTYECVYGRRMDSYGPRLGRPPHIGWLHLVN